jgi:heat shock protein HslJ
MKKVIYYVLMVGVVAILAYLGFRIIGSNDQPAASGGSSATGSIQNINWQWSSLMDEGTPSNIPNPADYTIMFNSDGTLTGKADCNTFSGTYSQANGFTITISTSTMAFCGDASLDLMYTTLLGNVSAGGPDGNGGLALETAGGAQRMTFTK